MFTAASLRRFGHLCISAVVLSFTPGVALAADGNSVVVNVDNFVRAETAAQFDRAVGIAGGTNQWYHFREPAPIDQQTVIRMNRDTLYSGAVVDISKGAKLTIPDAGDRYMSVMIVNEDHYINRILHDPGTYELSMDEFDTPYVLLAVRTLVNASDPEDLKKVNALQDQFIIEASSAQPYSHPAYDAASYKATYDPLIELGRGVPDTRRTFGKKEDVDQVRHLLGTAWGWAGLPEQEAYYLNVEPNLPVGAYQLQIKDVPVDAFWSVSVYNRDGYFEKNEVGLYSVNSVTGKPNTDGSFTIHLGGDPESVNYLPIDAGWNYTVRLYQPRAEVLDGSWTFPTVEPVR